MDWVAQQSSTPTSQLARAASHVAEFVPRISPSNLLNSTYPPVHGGGSPDTSPPSRSPPLPQDKANTSLPAYQENVGGTTYFYQMTAGAGGEPQESAAVTPCSSAPDYNVYTAKQEQPFFISSELQTDILNRNVLTLLQPDPQQYPELPTEVDNYHELYPLEAIQNGLHKTHPGHQSSMYKATHLKSGVHYCLRRIHAFRLQNTKCMAFVDQWKKLSHSNIVQLKEVFTTKAFGDNSMMFVYDFHPGSETLLNKHFAPSSAAADQAYVDPFSDAGTPRPYSYQKTNLLRHQRHHKLPEPLIWNYIIQLTAALRLIHSNGLACRSLDPTKIVVGTRGRLRLSCLGIMDVVMNESGALLAQHHQQEDLMALGKLVLALACKSTMAVQRDNISTALEMVKHTYTHDLYHLVIYLLNPQQRKALVELMPMIGARFYTQLDGLNGHADMLDHELAKEVQNGRLFRLMCKLGTVNERPELNMDAAWSETGDRYMLKLFRDYVFHQVTEDGRPWLDMAHIIQCLNKLDAAVPERICLMSRDEQSILVVSYAELKHCLDQSFHEVASQAVDVLAEDKM